MLQYLNRQALLTHWGVEYVGWPRGSGEKFTTCGSGMHVRIPIKPVPRKKAHFCDLKNVDSNGILSLFNDEIGLRPNFMIK